MNMFSNFLIEALRSATFGAWRMLTLGAEYSSWSRTDPSNKHRERRTCEDNDSQDESDMGDEETTYYDTVYELEGSFQSRNIQSIVDAHEAFSEETTAPWSSR